MAAYTLSARKDKRQISADKCDVSAENHEDQKYGISPFSGYDGLRAGREKLKPTLEGVYKES